MSAQQIITPELRAWILEQTQAGHGRDQVLAAMIGSGWDAAVARKALADTLTPEQPSSSSAGEAPTASKVPEPSLEGAPPSVWAGDRQVNILMALKHPRVVVFGGLLSDEECDQIVALSAARLARSETVATGTDGSEVNAARTSDGMFFERGENELIKRVEARLSALLNWPVDHGEGLQVLRYRPGAEYLPHYDYFEPNHVSTATILKRGGQRVASLVMYLNTPKAGGATTFPDVRLDVSPIKGNAVFFSYDRPHPMTLSLHGGAPVTEGEKWVATKWMRQGVFV
ncbi:2OG-Fe(II) oxygenase [Paucibacter sp. R3-3]|uniref:2OG-Fe(II) oxygenase n=1 Tax=Roseateles agri TaxID=3098619 RepID=A0ABU5DGB1_9BURK|nr:2OG-Fe(II) oxygenase [Paucibacter sp. R3-3]MDY0745316.1 2OG-Fe(II) oxygenase [Paucibacter sp. R3-3]